MLNTDVNTLDTGRSIVYFGALGWCAPCKQLHPMMEKLASQYDDVNFYYVDVDKHQELSAQSQIRAVPTVKVFSNGEEVESISGLKTKSVYESAIQNHLGA